MAQEFRQIIYLHKRSKHSSFASFNVSLRSCVMIRILLVQFTCNNSFFMVVLVLSDRPRSFWASNLNGDCWWMVNMATYRSFAPRLTHHLVLVPMARGVLDCSDLCTWNVVTFSFWFTCREKWWRRESRDFPLNIFISRATLPLPCTQTDDCEPTEIFRDHSDVAANKPGRLETLKQMFNELQEMQNEEQTLQMKRTRR